MADAFTTTTTSGWNQAAWDRYLYYAFREEMIAFALCDVKPTNQTNPGSTVTFFQANDMTVSTTPLSETVDVDAVALSDNSVTVTLQEYGNAAVSTQKLRLTSMIPVNEAITNILGANAAETLDKLTFNVLATGMNVVYGKDPSTGVRAAARVNITAGHVSKSADIRQARTVLRRNNVPRRGGLYTAIYHPDALYDLREETGSLGWRETVRSSEPTLQQILNGSVGIYEGFNILETTNAPMTANVGAGGTVDVYRNLYLGAQALACGYSNVEGYGLYPIAVKSPVVDKLDRQQGFGWKHFIGLGKFREQAIYAVEVASSLGAN